MPAWAACLLREIVNVVAPVSQDSILTVYQAQTGLSYDNAFEAAVDLLCFTHTRILPSNAITPP